MGGHFVSPIIKMTNQGWQMSAQVAEANPSSGFQLTCLVTCYATPVTWRALESPSLFVQPLCQPGQPSAK